MDAFAAMPFPDPERVSGLERRLGLDALLAAVIPQARPPVQVGRFIVEGRIGAGAMGVIHRARDPELDRPVAIKVTRRSCDRATRERVRHEARALARAAHPNVVAVHEIGCHEGELYVVMELVDGETLDAWVRRTTPGCASLLDACVQAGRGLAAAHRAGVVHCDFKPENVMIGRDGRVRVADFGVAIVSDGVNDGVDERVGPGLRGACTPHFAAPEVLADAPADARSDQYAYCTAVLELMSGCGLLNVLRPLLERGCSRCPEDRWPDMDALLQAMLAAASA
jgi:serine/threonine protein kinase